RFSRDWSSDVCSSDLSWIMRLEQGLFSLFGNEFSGKDLILLGGGLFLIAKATHEIHDNLEGEDPESAHGKKIVTASLAAILVQITILDLVFSVDSVITAVGMAKHVEILVAAIIVAVGVMMIFARPVGQFVEKHPTTKMLALSFLLLIGVTLLVEGFGGHIEKGYIYFAMGFSIFVEVLN